MKHTIFRSLNRSYIAVAVLMIFSIQLCAQTETGPDLAQYLFPGFATSRVKMKAGKDLTLILNYNTVTESMVFQQNGQFYDLVNPGSVDTVYLQTSRFIPVGKVFYEMVVNGPVPFFIQHRGILMLPGKPSAYGGTSELSSSNYISSVNRSNGYYNLKLPSDNIVKPSPLYWVRINDKMSNFVNERQFLKIFPDKADQIKKFIKKSGLNIEKREDLIMLGNFCNELMK